MKNLIFVDDKVIEVVNVMVVFVYIYNRRKF